jgi:hypothetical protein
MQPISAIVNCYHQKLFKTPFLGLVNRFGRFLPKTKRAPWGGRLNKLAMMAFEKHQFKYSTSA